MNFKGIMINTVVLINIEFEIIILIYGRQFDLRIDC